MLKDYLKKKTFNTMEEVVVYLNQRLKSNPNINQTKVEAVLKSLIKEKKISLGTRLVNEEILETPARNIIYNYIVDNPGTNVYEIMKINELGSNQVLWHLKLLKQYEYIRLATVNNKKSYFKYALNSSCDEIQICLRKEKCIQILQLLGKQQDSLGPTELSKLLKFHYNTVKKYLDVLVRNSIVDELEEKSKKLYSLNQNNLDRIREKIDLIIQEKYIEPELETRA